MTQHDLIIFDCDGVLIDSEIISAQMLIEALAQLGVTIDLPYVARNFLGRSYPTVMETIRRAFDLDLPASFEDDYRARLLAAFERDLQIMPHVGRVLAGLKIPFCIATSSSPARAAKSLSLVGLGHLVGPHLFTASMVAQGKPAPDLFLHAAAQMGGRNSLVIEDSLTGIRAAQAAHMAVWHFTGGSHMAGQGVLDDAMPFPNKTFASFENFLQMIENP